MGTFIPPALCELALREFYSFPISEAHIMHDGSKHDESIRRTLSRSPSPNHWLASIMFDVARQVNKEHWCFDIEGYEGLVQLTYVPTCHYDWHTDVHFNVDREYDRKLTVICLLNATDEFSGGQLQYKDLETGETRDIALDQGQIVAFPSFIMHRVLPVIDGMRHTAVLWVYGPRFK